MKLVWRHDIPDQTHLSSETRPRLRDARRRRTACSWATAMIEIESLHHHRRRPHPLRTVSGAARFGYKRGAKWRYGYLEKELGVSTEVRQDE